MIATQQPVKDAQDQYASSMLMLLEQMERIQQECQQPKSKTQKEVLPPIDSIVDMAPFVHSRKLQDQSFVPCSLQQLSRMIGEALSTPPQREYESPFCAPLVSPRTLPPISQKVVLPSVMDLDRDLQFFKTAQGSMLGKRKEREEERKTNTFETNINDQIMKRVKMEENWFIEQPSLEETVQRSDTNCGKQLICSGKIRRKNNKILPQDNFQMRWTLK